MLQTEHLASKILPIVGKPLQSEVAQREHGSEHHRRGNHREQRKIADGSEIQHGQECQRHSANARGKRSPTAYRRGAQHGEFVVARIREFLLKLVAVLPIGEILVHLIQVEHRRADAFGRRHQQVERGLLARAQLQRLHVVKYHGKYHHRTGFAHIAGSSGIIGDHPCNVSIVRLAHINAPIHGGRSRINSDCSTRSEREHGSRHFSARQRARMLVVDHMQQLRSAGRTHFRFVAPILDAAMILRTVEAAQREDDGDHTQDQSDHCNGDPCDQADARLFALLVAPLLFLLGFAFHNAVFDGGISGALHATGHTNVEHGDHVNIVAGTNVVHGELQRPFITTFGGGRAFGVQPSP